MLEPVHFKQLSFLMENWTSLPSYLDTAKKRTAISRLYYYVFLEIREIVKAKLSPSQLELLESESAKGRVHKILIELLKEAGLAKESKSLRKLRSIRNSADYNLQMAAIDMSLSKAKKLVQKLESSFQKIKDLPESQVQQAFNSVV